MLGGYSQQARPVVTREGREDRQSRASVYARASPKGLVSCSIPSLSRVVKNSQNRAGFSHVPVALAPIHVFYTSVSSKTAAKVDNRTPFSLNGSLERTTDLKGR